MRSPVLDPAKAWKAQATPLQPEFCPCAGAAIKGTDNPGAWLALLQWGGFVAPTLWLCRERGYDLAATFRFKWCCSSWWAGAAAAGPALFLATNAAVQLRLGGLDELALGGGAGLGPGWGAGGQPVGALLLLWVLLPAGERRDAAVGVFVAEGSERRQGCAAKGSRWGCR